MGHIKTMSPSIIFSVCKRGYEDKALHEAACAKLVRAGIPYKELSGFYRGVIEPTILVPAYYYELVEFLAVNSGQESILIFDQYCNMTVRQLDGVEYNLGQLMAHKECPHNCQAWTFDKTTGIYWIAG